MVGPRMIHPQNPPIWGPETPKVDFATPCLVRESPQRSAAGYDLRTGGDHLTALTLFIPALILGVIAVAFIIYFVSS